VNPVHGVRIPTSSLPPDSNPDRAITPDGIGPRLIPSMLRLLGPARMVLDRCAQQVPGSADEAADMAQRIVDWIGHPVTDEPAWATLPCQASDQGDCGACRPCEARVHAGYRPGLVDGIPVVDDGTR
jgi:hypothetical protein